MGTDRPSNPQESGQIKPFHALKSTKKVQGFDDLWASNPQNCGHQLAGASWGLLRATLCHCPKLAQEHVVACS